MSETLVPARGYVFAVPVDEIPATNLSVGFGGKTEKFKPETPYKLKVLAVGKSRPLGDNMWLECEARPGDIVSHVQTNATLRERIATTGFLLDGQQIMVLDFQDIIGIWEKSHCSGCSYGTGPDGIGTPDMP